MRKKSLNDITIDLPQLMIISGSWTF